MRSLLSPPRCRCRCAWRERGRRCCSSVTTGLKIIITWRSSARTVGGSAGARRAGRYRGVARVDRSFCAAGLGRVGSCDGRGAGEGRYRDRLWPVGRSAGRRRLRGLRDQPDVCVALPGRSHRRKKSGLQRQIDVPLRGGITTRKDYSRRAAANRMMLSSAGMSRACRCWPWSRLPAIARCRSRSGQPVSQRETFPGPRRPSHPDGHRRPMTAIIRRAYGSAAPVQPRSHDVSGDQPRVRQVTQPHVYEIAPALTPAGVSRRLAAGR